MSLPQFQIWRLWTPPTVFAPSCATTNNVNAALATLNARGDLNTTMRSNLLLSGGSGDPSTAATSTYTAPIRLLTVHPSLPLCAYVVSDNDKSSSNNNNNNTTNLLLVVQDLESGQVIGCFHYVEIAACLYGEKNSNKLPAAVKSLGSITNLSLMDVQSKFWNGVSLYPSSNNTNNGNTAVIAAPATPLWLVVQTTTRILVLSPRPSKYGGAIFVNQCKSTRQAWFVSHLHEKSLGGIPSSNILPLDAHNHVWLVGCKDGTLKAWNKSTHTPTKSIKGLGKGDWIVQILSANRYATIATKHVKQGLQQHQTQTPPSGASSSTTTAPPKRILTVTKKQSVYLIELETNPSLEIKPPLARFVLPDHLAGMVMDDTDDLPPPHQHNRTGMEHLFVSYDAHRDWLLWLVPATTSSTTASKKSNPITTLLIWNLKQLQSEFVKNADAKTVFRPEPTLTIQFPATAMTTSDTITASMTVASMVHTHFSETTTVCAVATSQGEIYIQAAISSSGNTKTIATPVVGQSIAQILMQSFQLEQPPTIPIQITSIHAPPLGERPLVIVGTNLGVLALEWDTTTAMLHNGAARHLHFGSGLGSLGKSVLGAVQSELRYSSLDVVRPNPVGYIDSNKNAVVVNESPPALQWPAEYQKRLFRASPSFLPSPSGLYVAVLWNSEFRYEILHLPSLLQKVTQRNNPGQVTATRNPVVASGSGITSFAWVGDQDDYAILHAEDVLEHAAMLMASAPVLVMPTAEGGLALSLPSLNPTNLNMSNLMDLRAGAMGVANLTSSAVKGATSATLSATKAATSAAANVTLNATKAATTATKAATDATLKVTKGTLNATKSTTKNVTKTVTKGVKKSLGIFGKKKKTDDSEGPSTITADDDDEEDTGMVPNGDMASMGNLQSLTMPSVQSMPSTKVSSSRHFVELRNLVQLESQSNEMAMSVPAATSSGLGELMLRGGNRNIPTCLFGGPVLIVASRTEDDPEGYAHFYTRKKDEQQDNQAKAYVSTGPTLPFPDLCEWDEDGVLCAVALQNRIAIYLSDQPKFTLLGMLRVPNTSKIVSIRIIHGVVYFTTWNSVHCVFLGSLEGDGVCPMDMYTLATAIVSTTSETTLTNTYTGIAPPIIALPLVQPVVIGYQSGSLLLSTARGTYAVPLSHPILRIGILLAAGQVERAAKWLDAFPNRDCEGLAVFLERRGHAELAISLPGLSLESMVDICMRFGYVGRLEEVVEEYGVKGLRSIDMSRGVSTGILGLEPNARSVAVCVGAYLLAHGKVELTRRIATELLRTGEDGRRDAFVLASLLLSVDESDATRLISRAVDKDGKSPDWLLGDFVREHILSQKP